MSNTNGFFIITAIPEKGALEGRQVNNMVDRDRSMVSLAEVYADRLQLQGLGLRSGSRVVVAETDYWHVYEIHASGAVGGRHRATHINWDGSRA